MRQAADALAEQGFVAICPDLFWRQEPNVELSDKTDWDGFSLHNRYDRNQGLRDIAAAIDAARVLDGAIGKVGLMDFYLRGLMTYLTAVRTNIDAGVWSYGGNTEAFLGEAAGLTAPFLIHVGAEDEYISHKRKRLLPLRLPTSPTC